MSAQGSKRPVWKTTSTGITSTEFLRVRKTVSDLFRERKDSLGLARSTDSEFIEFLLHRSAFQIQNNQGGEPSRYVHHKTLSFSVKDTGLYKNTLPETSSNRKYSR